MFQWVYLYKIDKKAFLVPGTLNRAANAEAVPLSRHPWDMRRDNVPALIALLQKFVEWSQVAEANHVQEVHKEIGTISIRDGQVLYFHREKGSSVSWLIVGNSSTLAAFYKLRASDVSAILELLEKLPEPDAQGFGTKPPPRAADSLFK